MLNKDGLVDLGYVPSESNIGDVRVIQEFYEEYLMPKVFIYQLHEDLSLTLKFHRTNFCHLLGLHYITSPSTKHLKYEGNSGYERITKEGLTLETLSSINAHEYALNRNRIIYFPFVYQLLQNPHAIDFDKAKVKKCTVECELMFYDEYHDMNIHLGIRSRGTDFFPVTFLVEPVGNTYKGDKFIKAQKPRKVYKVQIQQRKNENTV